MKRMATIVALASAVFLLVVPARAERPLVAVLDFSEIGSGLQAHEIELLGDVARGQALDTLGTAFNIITRENLVDLLKAHGKSLEQCQGECETETGRLIGADFVVSGRIVKAFGAYKVNLKVHRTSPPELLGAEVGTAASPVDLEAKVRAGTHAVLTPLLGKGAAPTAPAVSAPPQAVAPTPRPAPLAPAPARPTVTESAETADSGEVKAGLDVLADVGGFLFLGPALILEMGGKTRLNVSYRLVNLGLVSQALIDSESDTYETAYSLGTGLRWYGKGNAGMDGAFYGLGAEYVSIRTYNSWYGGYYEDDSIFPYGIFGYRWGSGSWPNQVGLALAFNYSLHHAVPEGAEDEGTTPMYVAVTYEIGIF